jgi:hypothetical protein
LKRHRPTLAVEEAANLAVPLVTYEAGLFWIVEDMVSTVLAVKYVPPYSKQMRPKGFEKMRLCGLRRKAVTEDFKEFLRVFWPEAFCMIALQDNQSVLTPGRGRDGTDLSITVMTGATNPAAKNPAVKSEANRRPIFFVFHTLDCDSDFAASGVRITVLDGVLEDMDVVGSSFGMGMSTPGIEGVIVWSFDSIRL